MKLHIGISKIVVCALLTWCLPSVGQLSQNSGINPNDTYAIFDAAIQGSGTTTLPQAIYNPTTGTTSNTLTLNTSPHVYHVEVGYDANDQLVMNLFPLDGGGDATVFGSLGVSKVQLVNGKLTVFDETGTPIPITAPNNISLPPALSILGPIPASSVLKALVVSNPYYFGSSLNAAVQYSTQTTTTSNRLAATVIPANSTVQMAYISMNTSGGGNVTMAYQQVGSVWVLVNNSVNSTVANTQVAHSSQFSNVSWFDNLDGDSRRAAKVTTPAPAPAPVDPTLSVPALPGASTTTANLNIQHPATGTTNILLQHGLNSDASTWDRMDPWLQKDFGFNYVVKPSLKWSDPLTNQANSLITLVSGSGIRNFLGVGYSQGGLITRDVAYRRFDLINNVITLDTPNNGAYITEVQRAAFAGAMTYLTKVMVAWGSGTPLSDAVSKLGNVLWLNIPASTVMAYDAAIPATTDLMPGSGYLNSLNGRSETFRRVGIEGASRWRFVEYRLAGDRSCNPEDWCGGRAMYSLANGVYYSLRTCELLAWIFGYYDVATFCGVTGFAMDYIDLFWYAYTSFGDTSDGIVQSSGQVYNRASFNHNIGGADSHSAVTKSDKVRNTLESSMQNEFNILPKWCMYGSASPTSFSVVDIGASSQAFSISTGSPCPWTAVSSVPWIRILSGSSGTTSGTVTFAVDINLSPVARTGTITITGLGTTPSVTVSQSGIPSAVSIGGVTISGGEQFVYPDTCGPYTYNASNASASTTGSVSPQRPICPAIYDYGTIYLTINGYLKTAGFRQGSNASSIAAALVSSINGDPSCPVRAGTIGTTVYFVSKATSSANYAYSTNVTWDSGDFDTPSFAATPLGSTMSGSPQ